MAWAGSTLVLAATHRDLGATENRQHVAIDPFQSNYWDDVGRLAVERAGLAGWTEVYEEYSSLQLPQLVKSGEEYDIVYIDGSHLFEDVFIDFYYVCRLVAVNGIVLLDDAAGSQVAKVLRFAQRNLSQALTEIDLGMYRLDGGRGLRYRLARRLGRVQLRAFQRVGKAERLACSMFKDF